MGHADVEKFVEQMEHWHAGVAQQHVKMAESIFTCPGREDGGDHLPRFSGADPTMRCTYCDEPLVVV